MGHGSKQMVIWRRKIRTVWGCGSTAIPPNSWIFVMVVHAVWGLALFCFKRTLFRLTNDGYISVSKFHELVPVVENKDPNRLHAHLEQTPSESHLQNSTRHTTLLWDRTNFFFNDDGRLMGTEPLFQGVRVAVIDPFFITCDSSPDKSIIHVITDKLTSDDRYPLYVEPVEVSIDEVQIYSFFMIFPAS